FRKWAHAQPTPRAFLPYAGSAQGLAPFETWDAADAHLNSRSVIPVVILSGAKDLCILPRQNRECIQKQSRGCIQNDCGIYGSSPLRMIRRILSNGRLANIRKQTEPTEESNHHFRGRIT